MDEEQELQEEKESTICKRCGEFIGAYDDLDVCPLCGFSLVILEDEYGFCYGVEDCDDF